MDNFARALRAGRQKLRNSKRRTPNFCRFLLSFSLRTGRARGFHGESRKRMADFLGSRDLNKPELAVDAWLVMRYITPKDEERERNDGFFIVNTGPCEARSCSRDRLFTITPAVWLTPNSKSMTPNHLCLDHD